MSDERDIHSFPLMGMGKPLKPLEAMTQLDHDRVRDMDVQNDSFAAALAAKKNRPAAPQASPAPAEPVPAPHAPAGEYVAPASPYPDGLLAGADEKTWANFIALKKKYPDCAFELLMFSIARRGLNLSAYIRHIFSTCPELGAADEDVQKFLVTLLKALKNNLPFGAKYGSAYRGFADAIAKDLNITRAALMTPTLRHVFKKPGENLFTLPLDEYLARHSMDDAALADACATSGERDVELWKQRIAGFRQGVLAPFNEKGGHTLLATVLAAVLEMPVSVLYPPIYAFDDVLPRYDRYWAGIRPASWPVPPRETPKAATVEKTVEKKPVAKPTPAPAPAPAPSPTPTTNTQAAEKPASEPAPTSKEPIAEKRARVEEKPASAPASAPKKPLQHARKPARVPEFSLPEPIIHAPPPLEEFRLSDADGKTITYRLRPRRRGEPPRNEAEALHDVTRAYPTCLLPSLLDVMAKDYFQTREAPLLGRVLVLARRKGIDLQPLAVNAMLQGNPTHVKEGHLEALSRGMGLDIEILKTEFETAVKLLPFRPAPPPGTDASPPGNGVSQGPS